jgi:hypothetical protein
MEREQSKTVECECSPRKDSQPSSGWTYCCEDVYTRRSTRCTLSLQRRTAMIQTHSYQRLFFLLVVSATAVLKGRKCWIGTLLTSNGETPNSLLLMCTFKATKVPSVSIHSLSNSILQVRTLSFIQSVVLTIESHKYQKSSNQIHQATTTTQWL